MRFDTRDKKPKVWNIAILSALAALVLAVLAAGGSERHVLGIAFTFDVYLGLVLVLLLRAFFAQIQYNPYSYNTIYYIGFFLFLLSVFVTHMILTVRLVREPDLYLGQNFAQILSLLTNSARTYMILSLPFILVFSLALCISNLSLLRHEGKRLVNILGILLALLLVGGEAFLLCFDADVSGSATQILVHDLFSNLLASLYLYGECMVIGTMITGALVSRHNPEYNKDFVIILGCSLLRDGSPTPLLRGRIHRAIAFSKEQKAQTGKDLIFVTSGGKGSDERNSESAAMKAYLLQQGIPADRILEEDQSTNTYENMKFSKAKILERKPQAKIAFSTTNFHVFRSGLYARKLKMRAEGMGAKTKWYFWPNAAVREFIGLLKDHKRKQVIIIGSIVVIYGLLTFFNYR